MLDFPLGMILRPDVNRFNVTAKHVTQLVKDLPLRGREEGQLGIEWGRAFNIFDHRLGIIRQ